MLPNLLVRLMVDGKCVCVHVDNTPSNKYISVKAVINLDFTLLTQVPHWRYCRSCGKSTV